MPKFYNKMVGRRKIEHRIRQHTPDRDAIVWSVDAEAKIANVKIQGSNTLIQVPYHMTMFSVPSYVRPGAAVTVRHRGGNKGFWEISGTARTIPTPVSGSGSLPDQNTTDVVLTGMEVSVTDPTSWCVSISAGTYRYDEVIYVFSGTSNWYYTMDDPAPLVMGNDPVVMGGQFYAICFDPAPVTINYGRYDILVIGPHDNSVDVIKGAEVNLSTTTPTMPSVPSGHILIGWVFITGADTAITSEMVNLTYGTPAPEQTTITLSGSWVTANQLEWNATPPPMPDCTITISCKDQYGGTYGFGGAMGTLTLVGGYGLVYGIYSGWRSDYALAKHNSSITFKYQRDQDEDEFRPIFTYECSNFAYVFTITLLDALGDPID